MITKTQYKCLFLIAKAIQESGYCPSYDELAVNLGLKSRSGIHRLVKSLEERGFLKRNPHRARSLQIMRMPERLQNELQRLKQQAKDQLNFGDRDIIGAMDADTSTVLTLADAVHAPLQGRMVDKYNDSVTIPLYGKIAAGTPIYALSDNATEITVPGILVKQGLHYALEVEGESMSGIGILDSDIAIIEKVEYARSGDVVVALIDNDTATLKTYSTDPPFVILSPANENYSTQRLPNEQVQIQGRLAGILRRYT